MNKQRRKKLDEIYEKIAELMDWLEEVKDEEEECKENMPENLHNSERYEIADEACYNLDCALDSLNDALNYIESAAQ